MEKPGLYFIALLPHRELSDEISELKEEMKILTGAKDILKSPAHITLQKPFKRNAGDEPAIVRSLRRFSSTVQPFNVDLVGFGSFAPRVIFIRVADHGPLISLHSELKKCLTGELGFSSSEIMDDIHPHITLTTRYLTRQGFEDAWPLFRERAFEDSFAADTISLLKHDGRRWEVLSRFRMGAKD